MGFSLWGRIGLFVTTFVFLASANADKYIVVMKSASSYRIAKDVSQRSGGFLGTRAATKSYLDHLEMAIVESDSEQINAVRANPHVAYVEKEYVIPAPRLPLNRNDLAPQGVKFKDLTWGLKAISAEGAWAHTKGAGARVLLLDSGVDMNHPDLVGRFEQGKALMGTSFLDVDGHGTHTAGTVLADGAGSGLKGVAPEAKLLAGKVCSGAGCNSTAIVEGINWAVAEKVDVVNMSLGGPFLMPAAAAAYQKAEAAGVMIVAASGNGGSANVSYPAAVDTVLAVGAVNPDLTKAGFSQWGPQLDVVAPGVDVISSVPKGMGRAGLVKVDIGFGPEELENAPMSNSEPGLAMFSGEFVHIGLGKPADVQGISLAGKFALIQRGEITFTEKVDAAMGAGAIGVLIYNNAPGLIFGGLDKVVNIPVIMIEQTAGELIVEKLTQKQAVAVEAGIVATDYASMQGTSMASPHAAGVAALVRAANKSLTPAEVRDIIKNSATPLTPNANNQLGKGLINAEKAVQMALSVLPPQVSGF